MLDAPAHTRRRRLALAVGCLIVVPAVAFAAAGNAGPAVPPADTGLGAYAPLAVYFTLAISISFLCSLLEATILSISAGQVEALAASGKRAGLILRDLKQRIDRPLIAILTTNTVANMLGAAGVGAEAQALANAKGWREDIFVFGAATLLTVVILVFSEIVPKTLGAAYAKTIAGPAAYVLRGLVILLTPVIVLLEGLPRMIAGKSDDGAVTKEEIAALVDLGHRSGSLQAREGRFIANVFALDTVRAKDVMTPRVEAFTLDRLMTVEAVLAKHKRLRHSRIPVYSGDPDTIVGMVLRYRLFEEALRGGTAQHLHELLVPIHAVPETTKLGKLLDTFIQRNDQLFLVVDEYGGTAGIITLEDVVETLLGVEIVDESDAVDNLRRLARERMQEKMRRRTEREARDDPRLR